MLRPDTGNFNRFLTSLGLLLLAAALIVPYFYFQNTETLRIPAAELRELTKTGRETLEGRQDAIETLETWVVGFSVGLGVVGLGLLIFGGRRLRHAQASEEEEDELRKTRARAEIRRMSPEQVEDKRDAQAREELVEPEEAAPPATRPPAQPRDESGLRNLGDVRYRQRRDAIARIEAKAVQIFDTAKFESHAFFGNIMVSAAGGDSLELDGLFEARDVDVHRDVVMELKLAPVKRGQIYTESLFAAIARYRAITERQAFGWLVLVVPAEEPADGDTAITAARLTNRLAPAGLATVIQEQELDELPTRFQSIVASGLTLRREG